MQWSVYVTCPGESSHVVCEVSKRVTEDILFLDENIEGSNILMCFLTPLGVTFKSGVTGSNTNKSQSHHSYNTTICSIWFGEVLKSSQQQQICPNTTHCEVYGGQAGPRSQSSVGITKHYCDSFTYFVALFLFLHRL